MLHNWTNFFEITAAAGDQLIGLMFVVVTLGTTLSKSQSVAGIHAFVTPTLICFSGVLFQALVVLAPWPSDRPVGFMLVLAGLVGGAYRIIAIRSQGKLDFAALHAVDWIAHNGLPVVANVSVICGGAGLSLESPSPPTRSRRRVRSCWSQESMAPGT